MKKWLLKKNNTFSILIVILIIISQSCADLSSDPNQNSNPSNLKIQIISPSSDGTLMEGNNEIIYSIAQTY